MELTTEMAEEFFSYGADGDYTREDFLRWLSGVKADTLDRAAEALQQRAPNVSNGYCRIGVEQSVAWLRRRAEDVEADW